MPVLRSGNAGSGDLHKSADSHKDRLDSIKDAYKHHQGNLVGAVPVTFSKALKNASPVSQSEKPKQKHAGTDLDQFFKDWQEEHKTHPVLARDLIKEARESAQIDNRVHTEPKYYKNIFKKNKDDK